MAERRAEGMIEINGVPTPASPKELWLFWASEGPGHWIPSLDDAPSGQTFLVAFSEAEALKAAAYERDFYDIDCYPVKFEVKQAEG